MRLAPIIPMLATAVRDLVRGYNDRALVREMLTAATSLDQSSALDVAELLAYLDRFAERLTPELKDKLLLTCLDIAKHRDQRLAALEKGL